MQTARRTKVFIVEDSAPIRERLVELLTAIEGASVVGEAATPSGAVAGIRSTHPDCVVLDLQLLGGTGIEVLRELHPEAPQIVFVVLTNHPTAQHRRICTQAGASFFLDKSSEFGKIRDLIARLNLVPH